MDQRLKRLIEELGVAMNNSVFESESVAEAIARIKTEGYDVFLVLNAMVAIRNPEAEPVSLPARKNGAVEFRCNAEDRKFLRSLHIAVNG